MQTELLCKMNCHQTTKTTIFVWLESNFKQQAVMPSVVKFIKNNISELSSSEYLLAISSSNYSCRYRTACNTNSDANSSSWRIIFIYQNSWSCLKHYHVRPQNTPGDEFLACCKILLTCANKDKRRHSKDSKGLTFSGYCTKQHQNSTSRHCIYIAH